MHSILLEAASPDIFDGVTKVEVEVLCDGDALHTGWVLSVMLRMIYLVTHLAPFAPSFPMVFLNPIFPAT